MKERLRILPMKMLAAFCLVLGGVPLSILLGRLFAADTPVLWWLPPLIAWVWACLGYLLPVKGRLLFALLGCALFAVWGAVFQLPLDFRRLLLLLPCMAALLALPSAWGRPAWDEWPPGAWMGGVVLHLAAQTVSGGPLFQGVLPWLLPCFAVYVFLYVLCLNRHGLADGMHGTGKAPAAIRQRNTILSAVFFLFALAASSWQRLAEWADAAWNFILRVIAAAVDFIMRLLPEARMGSGGSDGDLGGMLGGLEAAEPSAFALFMEKVFQVLALILLLILLFFAGKALYKGWKKLWKKLMAYLRRYAAEAGEDYIDETESTVNWDERTQTIRDQVMSVFHREKPERWESMNGRDRVRYLYRQFLRRRPEAKNKTAREALRAEKGYTQNQARTFTEMYEQARYSERDISESDADALRNTIKG